MWLSCHWPLSFSTTSKCPTTSFRAAQMKLSQLTGFFFSIQSIVTIFGVERESWLPSMPMIPFEMSTDSILNSSLRRLVLIDRLSSFCGVPGTAIV